MRIERRRVFWWEGYETLFVADPPLVPHPIEVGEARRFIRDEKALLYVPIPFREFADLPPLRHYPHERWERALDSLRRSGDSIENMTFADIGANIGYYAFLAVAAGAREAYSVEAAPKATWITSHVAAMYGLSARVFTEETLFEEWPFEDHSIDIAFAFSSLPYIGQKDPEPLRAMLARMARHVAVSFIEMGDGGSALSWCVGDEAFEALFREAGFTRVENLGSIFSSHTNTQRTLWRCHGKPY